MARSWPERLAKRIGRLMTNLDQIEAKGRTSDKSYARMLEELGDLCCQIIEAADQAKSERDQARTDAIFSRRKLAEEWEAFKQERDEFQVSREQDRNVLRKGRDDLKRQMDEMAVERAALAEELDMTKAERRKYQTAVETFRKGMAKL